MAGALLRRRLADRGCGASIATAGFLAEGQAALPEVVETMSTLGIDLGRHRSRRVEPAMLDAADIVATMTRQHVVEIVASRPAAWPRTFTLRELVRRAEAIGALTPDRDLAPWVALVGAWRTREGVLRLPLREDIADPMGGHQREFDRTRDELDGWISRLAELLCPPQEHPPDVEAPAPWRRGPPFTSLPDQNPDIPTMGRFRCSPPFDPRNEAFPKVKIPPSVATSR